MLRLKVFDAFCGIGGIRLGFEKYNDYFKTVISIDYNKYCKYTYDCNFGTSKLILKDINKIKIKKLPYFDILTAGFPCQPFSLAGKKKGMDDERSNVILKIIEIIKIKKPKIILFENVKNLKTIHNSKPYKYRIYSK